MSRASATGPEEIYLDHAATSPLLWPVWKAMEAALGQADYNPASTHGCGRRAHERLEQARATVARAIGAHRSNLCFTSGGTQSNNLAILGFVRANAAASPRVLVTAVEHKAVLQTAQHAAAEGAEVGVLPVDRTGTVDLDALEEALGADGERPTLVSMMWANNEIGTVQPIAEALELARRFGATFHTDAVQAFGKLPVSVEEVPVDMLTITAHKVGGPVGIGALYKRPDATIEPITFGGSQERALWPGTQNVLSAIGFAEAARLATEQLEEHVAAWTALRDRLAEKLRSGIDEVVFHGEGAPRRMPNLLNVGLPNCDQVALLIGLDLERVAVSAGSACSSGSADPSHVLGAIGVAPQMDSYAALRFSFGPDTTERGVDRAADVVARAAKRLR